MHPLLPISIWISLMLISLAILLINFVDKEGKQMLLKLLIKTIIVVAGIAFIIWFANYEVKEWFK